MSEFLTDLESLSAELLTPANTLILFHRNPDADAIGSAFALRRVMEELGSRSYCVCCDEVPAHLRFLLADVQSSVLTDSVPADFEAGRIVEREIGEALGLMTEEIEENAVLAAGKNMEELSMAELDAIWDSIKHRT